MSKEIPPNPLPSARENSAANTEAPKDQYSLDEMMKTLRDQERDKEEKGEVVTRSDGSVARKVKRRRRRSDQDENATSEKEKKSLLFKVVMAASLILILFLTGFFLILSRNSKGHRQEIEQTASEWTGAEVQLSGFKRLPFSAKIQGAEFKWPASSYLRELNVSRIDGDVGFSSFLGARPGGLQIGGAAGKMIVGMPTASEEVGQSFEEDDFPFSFDQYYCQALDVTFGENGSLALKGVSTSLRHVSNEGFQLTIDQGTLQLDGWKSFPISTGLVRFNDGVMDIKSLSLDPVQSDDSLYTSSLKISGKIPLTVGEKVRLVTETGNFSLSGLIGKRLSRLFNGAVIESTGEIHYTVGEDEIDEVVMRFSAERVSITSFPFLANLADLFPDRQLETLEFTNGLTDSAITGILRMRPEGIAIEKLEMAQKGNVRFKGNLIVSKAGKITGNAELWLNRAIVIGNPRLANSNILRGSENTGYVKVDFKFGGTLAQPDDTFRSQIGMEAALPEFGNKPKDGIDELWKDLTE